MTVVRGLKLNGRTWRQPSTTRRDTSTHEHTTLERHLHD